MPDSNSQFEINTITVVGANGTIGAKVSGLLAAFCDARVFLISRTIEKSIAAKEIAIGSVRCDAIAEKLIPMTFQNLPECISKSEWIFESVSEDTGIKMSIHRQIAECLRPGTFVSSSTSGLSIEDLASSYNEEGRKRFFGTHFFNPPYSLPLLEFIETRWTDKTAANWFFSFLETTTQRKIIHVKDRAAFLGNRIGFVFMNEALQFAELYKNRGGIDYIDAILGPFTGRAMAPIETIDFVGIDTHKAIVEHLHSCEPDFFGSECIFPSFAAALVDEGKTGKKVGAGFFKSAFDGNGIKQKLVYDIESASYRLKKKYIMRFAEDMVQFIGDGLYKKAFDALLKNDSEEAAICRYFMVKYVICSYLSAIDVSNGVSDADVAMSYGFNWAPPSAICSLLGGRNGIEKMIETDERIKIFLYGIDLSILDEQVYHAEIDYRRYFKAAL